MGEAGIGVDDLDRDNHACGESSIEALGRNYRRNGLVASGVGG